jgi:nucleoside-diphosphate-sugar epimerase
MSRYLVTGGAGRLGRSVVTVLAAAGHEVVSIDKSTVPDLPAIQVEADLLEHGAAARLIATFRPTGVVHLAAVPVPFALPDDETYAINTSLAFAVLEASLAAGVGAVLVASSPTVVGYGAPGGWIPRYLPLDEAHPVEPWNGYALSKVAIEELVAMLARRAPDGPRLGAFRPCYVIAPEEWSGAPTQQGHTVTERLDDPSLASVALFNYLDARDAGDFVLAWFESGDAVPSGTVFFVGAADSLVRGPVPEALATWVPGTADAARTLGDTDPVFSSARAADLLGWRARRSWRSELGHSDGGGAE